MMFSKYEVYTTIQSTYCYQDTNVLKNKMDIRDNNILKQVELQITQLNQLCLLDTPIKGRFSKTQLLNIHKFLFQDIYPFAGKIRKEQISKGDTMFYPPHKINSALDNIFTRIHSSNMLKETNPETQIANLSGIMAALNLIHPFREGNGRCIREFIRCMALEYKMAINWDNVAPETLLKASIASVDDELAFFDIICRCIEK